MPIKNLSETVRLPRLGKIRLGTRHPEKGYPQKSDHFILPKEHSSYDKLVEIYGDEPKELRIYIPVEDDEQWATQYYKAYNQTYGLVCKGDGEVALRMIHVKTGNLPNKNTAGVGTLKVVECKGRDCPEYKEKKCHEVMNLRFVLPEVPGLGVWQIDTGSRNSIININASARLIKKTFGRISLIPLKLTFEPIQVNNPETGKKQTVYVLNLRTDVTLAQLADNAREQSQSLMLDVATLKNAFDIEVQKDIDELWGPVDKIDEVVTPPDPSPDAPESTPVATKEEGDGITITTEELLSKVAEAKSWPNSKAVRSWLVNGPCKIAESRIDQEPGKVWEEVAPLL